MENDFIYTPSSTDITIRWRKVYGYVPARMGWKKSGVVLVRLIDQKLVLSW